MKIRSDFVTNSSSSSFIVVFGNRKDYMNAVYKMAILGVPDEYINIIWNDIVSNKISREELLKHLKEHEKSMAEYVLGWKDRNWKECREFLSSKEGKAAVKAYVDSHMEEHKRNLPKRCEYCGILEYGDEDGNFYATLEHDIMPRMPFVFKRIDNH